MIFGGRFKLETLRVLLIALGMLLLVSAVSAEQRELQTDSKEMIDAVLLLDSSGSMLLTDPQRLRDEGAKLFVEFLRPDDRLSIIEFSKDANVLRPLAPFKTDERDKILETLKQVKTTGEYTDLLAPIKRAKEILEGSPRENAQQIIIMLSDGKMDPDPKVGTASALSNELLNTVLPQLKAKDLKVYTLSFSDQANQYLLSQIAAGTNGVHWFTPTSDKIHQSFADLFVVVKKPQMLPMSSQGFRIDAEVQEATFYINRDGDEEVTLISPSARKLTAASADGDTLKWFKGQKFDVITVMSPEAGQWQIQGLPKNEWFATVLTSLKLTTSFPAVIVSGMPAILEARLYEGKKPVVLPQMTGAVSYTYEVTPTDQVSEPIIRDKLVDDGTHGDKIAGDGIFSAKVEIEPAGEYRLRVMAMGPTFERYQQLAFRVKPRMISVDVISQDASLLPHNMGDEGQAGSDSQTAEGEQDYFRVQLSSELSGSKKTQVKLIALDPNRKRYVLPLAKADELLFFAPVSALPREGKYQIRASFETEGKRRERVQGESSVLEYQKAPRSGEEPEIEVVVVDKKKEKVETPSFFLPLLLWLALITLLNGGGGYLGRESLKKSQSQGAVVTVEKFESVDAFVAALMTLEKKAEAVTVDMEDPVFSTASSVQVPLRSRSAEAPPPSAEKPAAAESQPEPDEEAGEEVAVNGEGQESSGEEVVEEESAEEELEGEAGEGAEEEPQEQDPDAQDDDTERE